jgi:hypothetical protein
MIMDSKITNAKEALYCSVKTAVCVRKPGPIAEVAIMNAAPIMIEKVFFFVIGFEFTLGVAIV